MASRAGSSLPPTTSIRRYLELRLTVRDSAGVTHSTSVELQPQVVDLTFESVPAGLQLVLGSTSRVAPFIGRVIVGSNSSVSASSPQSLGGQGYGFSSWSDGGAQTHNIVAPAAPATYRATFQALSAPTPSVTISDVTVVEGNTGTVTAVFIVSLSSPSGSVVEVDYTTVGGSATSGLDFEPRQDTLTIAPGSTTGSISVAVIGDIVREPTESFRVDLTAARGATLLDASGVGKSSDNDKGKR